MSSAAGARKTFALPQRPYPGLRPFTSDEWPVFFGRERMVDEVIDQLIDDRLLVVHGDSGCGKSSLIRAGVLPRLEQDYARSQAGWVTCTTTPGDEPLANLANELAKLEGEADFETRRLEIRRILNRGRDGADALAEYVGRSRREHVCILIDQFEELFAHARRHGRLQASLLIDLVIGLQERDENAPFPLYVVLTMRSEFLGACAQFQGFAQAVNATQYLLPRMEHADLVRAIREPALLYGGEVTRELAERLIADAGGTQDQLPLIQHALMLLHRNSGATGGKPWRLTIEHYPKTGGLGQLLSEHADEVMRSVTDASGAGERAVAEMFRALTEINADRQAIRRPQKLEDLIRVSGAPEPLVRRILDAFRAEGVSFLRPYGHDAVQPQDYVDISHEALIRCWKRIADERDGWLNHEFKDGLVWRSLLVQTESFERDRSSVLSPATCEERESWLSGRNGPWSERYGGGWERVQRLIAASVNERSRQRRQRVIQLVSALALVLTTIVGFAAFTAYRARSGEQQALQKLADENKRLAEVSRKAAEDAEAKQRAADEFATQLRAQLAALKAAAPAQSSYSKSLDIAENNIAQQVDQLSRATRATVAVTPRIYIHIADASQRAAAREVEQGIEAARLPDNVVVTVPGIQLISNPPSYSLLRCFVEADCQQWGPMMLDLVNAQLESPKVRLQDFSKTYTDSKAIRPQHFELYFTADPIVPRSRKY